MRDPNYQDFFLRAPNLTTSQDGYIPATTYCAQMGQPHDDPKCLCWYLLWVIYICQRILQFDPDSGIKTLFRSRYWNLFNETAVEYYLNELLLPQATKPGFDGVFFDGSDGFMRGTWKQATNVKPGLTDSDALQAVIRCVFGHLTSSSPHPHLTSSSPNPPIDRIVAPISFHKKGAELLQKHGKYAIYSEHLADTTSEQQQVYSKQMQDTGFFRFYEGFHATEAYIEMILNETQPANADANPLPVVLHSGPSPASFAAFLIVRTNYSYYMSSHGWLDGGWSWQPDYDFNVGEPLGPAQKRTGSGGTVYTRSYSNCDVTVDCSGNASISDAPLWNCNVVNCSCQDFAQYYGVHPGKGFGCAPTGAQDWWRGKPCSASAGAELCCGGPACSLPGHARCICPQGPGPWPSPPPPAAACMGTIKMKSY